MRQAFIDTTTALLDDDPRVALVLADISADSFSTAARNHPDRVLNVGIREQLMISTAGGLALTGLRSIAHSYAPFLIDRAYEQIKLDLGHQGVGAILASVGASYDGATAGRTHQSPMDVALLDSLDGWSIHVPGHPSEVGPLLRAAVDHDDPVYLRLSTQQNRDGHPGATLLPLREGRLATVIAVGPMLDPVLAAVDGLDVTVAYTTTPRPFDVTGLRALHHDGVVLVEPYLAGTSAWVITQALADRPHRLLSLGVGRQDARRYGDPANHAEWHGLHPAGLRRSITAFVNAPPVSTTDQAGT